MVYKAVLQLVKQALSKSKKPKIQSVPGSSSSYVNVILPQVRLFGHKGPTTIYIISLL